MCCLDVVCIYENCFSFAVSCNDSIELPFSRAYYKYEDVSDVYYISARYNENGDRIERPSYVIALKDGRKYDFYGTASIETTGEYVLPAFESHGFTVKRVDSDRDLPE